MKPDIIADKTPSAMTDTLYQFLNQFRPIKSKKNPSGQIKYPDIIDNMYPRQSTWVEIDFNDFVGESNLEDYFLADPDFFMDALNEAVWQTLHTRFVDYAKDFRDKIRARISNYPSMWGIRDIGAETSGKFVSVKAMMIRSSAIDSIPMKAVYRCEKGHEREFRAKRDYSIEMPVLCEAEKCNSKELELVPKKCDFINYQIIELQELTSDLPEGQTPKSISVFVADDLVDEARLGDIVEVAGMVRVEKSKELKLAKEIQTYRQRIYANNITRLTQDKVEKEITIAERKRFAQMVAKENATRKIVNSFASHVYGHDLVKEALILTMIGGDSKTLPNGSKVRGDINILMVGDPGVAKSEMGKAIQRIAPRAFYTSGKGSSAAGLTAAVVKDDITGRYMLSPGVTALADQGLVVIDEFDKMDTRDRSALHEVMEQQSVSISKAGINSTLNTRCSVIAIANPAFGKYDPFKNLTENVPSIPIPLLTRFDLIFVLKDVADNDMDDVIADHVLSMYTQQDSKPDLLTNEDFAKYIRVAKSMHPVLSEQARAKIKEYYQKMRKTEEGMTVTVRQLEGITRLTVARAKMLLKDTADESDAERAIYIMDEMLKTSGVDVTTGQVDVGVLHGMPKSQVSKMQLFQDIFKKLKNDKGMVNERELIENLVNSEQFNSTDAHGMIDKMRQASIIYEPKSGWYANV